MIKASLNEREFELINIVGAHLGSNQRDLSRHLNLSLGMTNLLIRRLISKGYIRIRQLDKRKVEYILTPQGLTEKMQKSVKYVVNTIRSIGLIKERIKEIVLPFYNQGIRNFFVIGKSDLALLIEMVLQESRLAGYKIHYIREFPSCDVDGVILICEEDVEDKGYPGTNKVDLLKELAQNSNII